MRLEFQGKPCDGVVLLEEIPAKVLYVLPVCGSVLARGGDEYVTFIVFI